MKFEETKWDVRNWTKDMKIQFQVECFKLGYGWIFTHLVQNTHADFYFLESDSCITYEAGDLNYFNNYPYKERTWEDMFPPQPEASRTPLSEYTSSELLAELTRREEK